MNMERMIVSKIYEIAEEIVDLILQKILKIFLTLTIKPTYESQKMNFRVRGPHYWNKLELSHNQFIP